jgi:Concanavalin A-like lectin/glucanases superfamily
MALTFDGANYITKASALVSAAPMTFCCLFTTPSSISADAYVMGIASGTSAHFSLFAMKFLTASAKMCCYISNDAGSTTDNTAASSTTLSASTTYHVACVFTSTTSRTCYVNGGGSTNSTVSVTPGTCDSSYIGSVKFNGAVATGTLGTIAFPMIYGAALSATDVASLAKAVGPQHVRTSNLVSYLRLTGGNSPEPDYMSTTGWTLVAG